MLIDVVKKLLRAGPRRDAATYVRLARDHLEHGRPQEAIEAACTALGMDPLNAEALYLRGTARLEAGEPDSALPDLKRAADLCDAEPRYLYNLAVAHWHLGEAGAAETACRRIVEHRDFREAHQLLGHIEMGGEIYCDVLSRLHAHLRPATYLEIGVASGLSLARVHPETRAVGVDPSPQIEVSLAPNHSVFAQTSDRFFADNDVPALFGGRRVDMAFIDGMHRFEYALSDFANIERVSHPGTVVLIHDCYPLDRKTSERERCTTFWSGDIWRLVVLLKKHRPDLRVHTLGAPPTGLGMVLNLDPSSRLLFDQHDALVAEYLAMDYSVIEDCRKEKLGFVENDWPLIQQLLDSRTAA